MRSRCNKRVEAEKKRFQGEEIYGKTLGVVGLGAIGALVAEAGLRLGMNVLGYDPAISVDAAWRLPSDVQRMENLPTLFARSDYVTLHVPLLAETRNMINEESLKSFRPAPVLLNFARQEIVDEAGAVACVERPAGWRVIFRTFRHRRWRGCPTYLLRRTSVRARPRRKRTAR